MFGIQGLTSCPDGEDGLTHCKVYATKMLEVAFQQWGDAPVFIKANKQTTTPLEKLEHFPNDPKQLNRVELFVEYQVIFFHHLDMQ